MFGLLPQKRGPQGGHKLTTEVMEFVANSDLPIPRSPPGQLADAIQKTLPDSGPSAEHSAAPAAAKKTAVKPSLAGSSSAALRSSYEDLRAQALAGGPRTGAAPCFCITACASGWKSVPVYRGRCRRRTRRGDPPTLNCCRQACDRDRRHSGRNVFWNSNGR